MLGLVGMDHVGLTVPDIDEAVQWFQHNVGCAAPLTFGPFADPTTSDPSQNFMSTLLDVDPAAAIEQITMIRCGRSSNIELMEYLAPDQRRSHPLNSDWSGHHVAFYVTDIDAAVADFQAKGVEKYLGPVPVTDGPAAGQSTNYFRTPFGTYIELISYPQGMAYEKSAHPALWSPKANGRRASVTSVPGLLGVDHVGITVPDLPAAKAWFTDVLGCTSPLSFGPFLDSSTTDPSQNFMSLLLGVRPETVLNQITMMRCGNGANIELFDYTAPDQDRTFRKNSDWGAKHLAFYVRDMNSAVAYMQAKGVYKLAGPLTVTDGPAAGQTINYFRTPFGTYVELISYPKGMAYEASADIPLWDPRDNRPGPRSGRH